MGVGDYVAFDMNERRQMFKRRRICERQCRFAVLRWEVREVQFAFASQSLLGEFSIALEKQLAKSIMLDLDRVLSVTPLITNTPIANPQCGGQMRSRNVQRCFKWIDDTARK